MHDVTPAIEAIDLFRSLPLGSETISILRGLTFRIERGEWVALTGPSGSGKSTLLGILAGLDTPTSGSILIEGVDIAKLPERHLARLRNSKIGVVFQSFNLIGALTALENVEAPLHIHSGRASARAAAREILDRVGLSDRLHHRPHQLSGGQQQRVAIARALVTKPALLVADEPTGNLDSTTGAHVLDLIADLRRELNVTVIVATHDPDVAGRADRVLHIVDGRLTDANVFSESISLVGAR
ncbi:MAG: ABC transporter ATP-binding protein [Blastocatellia bacterium]|jgi:putative ABC transport system ATP-binding protein|nr:ABC transporter ATP-binding protein [Blastocatellia bacterium]MBK6428359.1 ABC transporter ATP-binding protein [Blastocatellia bacterium]